MVSTMYCANVSRNFFCSISHRNHPDMDVLSEVIITYVYVVDAHARRHGRVPDNHWALRQEFTARFPDYAYDFKQPEEVADDDDKNNGPNVDGLDSALSVVKRGFITAGCEAHFVDICAAVDKMPDNPVGDWDVMSLSSTTPRCKPDDENSNENRFTEMSITLNEVQLELHVLHTHYTKLLARVRAAENKHEQRYDDLRLEMNLLKKTNRSRSRCSILHVALPYRHWARRMAARVAAIGTAIISILSLCVWRRNMPESFLHVCDKV